VLADSFIDVSSVTLYNLLLSLQKVVSSCFGKAFVMNSAVMLALPPSCFAEQCEPGYSLPNMPLLFAIAMVGATVGGKFIML
jgi:hypothetical protein